jgi:hypothetical protein
MIVAARGARKIAIVPADVVDYPEPPGRPCLRELNASGQSGFDGAAGVLELLATLPTPEEILNLRPSPRLAARVAEMIEKSRTGEMTPAEEEEWERYEYLEHPMPDRDA